MQHIEHDKFTVIGLSARVSNDDPSGIAAIWARFQENPGLGGFADKASPDLYCVYHDYEGDHTAPYRMTVGYRVPAATACPAGLSQVDIPVQNMARFDASGPQPGALMAQWQRIWASNLDRAYRADFDLYDATQDGRVTVHVGLRTG
ncbi:MAG: GyrI-like domain-containing protein [Qingshengfaniella sp.]